MSIRGSGDLVRVQLRLPTGVGAAAESLWATSAHGSGSGGTYRLACHAAWATLMAGDLVRAEHDWRQALQVTAIEKLEPGLLSYVDHPPDVEPGQVRDVLAAWTVSGAVRTEGVDTLLTTSWRQGTDATMLRLLLETTLPPGWSVLRIVDAPTRARDLQEEIDLALDAPVPAGWMRRSA